MAGFVKTIKNIWAIEELRNKILFTLGIILAYRLASFITLPAIDVAQFSAAFEDFQKQNANAGGIIGLLSSFTGGALTNASVTALGIMPYISASIIVQLMGMAVPYLQKLQKEGESGRKTLNQLTRWLTIAICLVQAPFYIVSITQQFVPYQQYSEAYNIDPVNQWYAFWIPSVVLLVAGAVFAMWMGEKITDKGIGNGISILIMVGILANFPNSILQEFVAREDNFVMFLLEIVIWLVVVLLCVMLVTAVRKVPLQYVGQIKRAGASGVAKAANAVRSFLPLKVNAAGVMPIIFAQALMFVPSLLAPGEDIENASNFRLFFNNFQDPFSWPYNVLFAILIIIFTYFYTAITINVNQIADDLKRSGGLIPKVKPGAETAEFLDGILSKITLPGSIFLAILAILPAIVNESLVENPGFSYFFGGTSLLIMVGVFIDTVQQINTYLLNHHYDGLMKSKMSRNPAYG